MEMLIIPTGTTTDTVLICIRINIMSTGQDNKNKEYNDVGFENETFALKFENKESGM
jgi:hypothetical protein